MGPLKVTEVFCYICRGILIEPVTLPCSHVFCFVCFEQSMQETSYSCPLCRRRISNWVRSVKRGNSLINEKLWKQIQEQYKDQVLLKLNGEDDGLDQCIQEEFPVFASTSNPGEVAQEFTKLLNDFRIEKEKLQAAEELASKALIAKLKEEEERQMKLLQENSFLRVKEDSILALKIQEELNKNVSSTPSSEKIKKNEKKSKKSSHTDKVPLKGPMDGYLSAKSAKHATPTTPEQTMGRGRSTSTDSTDSIRLEMNLFKPIRKVQRTPPKQYPDGRIREIGLTKVMPLRLNFNNLPGSSSPGSTLEGANIHSNHSAFVNTNSQGDESLSKRLKFSNESDSGVLKDITLEDNHDSSSSAQEDSLKKSNSLRRSAQEFIIPSKLSKFVDICGKEDDENDNFDTQDYLNPESSIDDRLIEEQKRIEKIIMQEKEDRKLALKLSREWELELNMKPQTRSMYNKTKNAINKKIQPTIIESVASRTRNKQK